MKQQMRVYPCVCVRAMHGAHGPCLSPGPWLLAASKTRVDLKRQRPRTIGLLPTITHASNATRSVIRAWQRAAKAHRSTMRLSLFHVIAQVDRATHPQVADVVQLVLSKINSDRDPSDFRLVSYDGTKPCSNYYTPGCAWRGWRVSLHDIHSPTKRSVAVRVVYPHTP